MDKFLARDIRHALADAMARHGLTWGGREDYAAGEALTTVSLPNKAEQPIEETQAVKYAHTRLAVLSRDNALGWYDADQLLEDIRLLCDAYDAVRQTERARASAQAAADRNEKRLAAIASAYAQGPAGFADAYLRLVREWSE